MRRPTVNVSILNRPRCVRIQLTVMLTLCLLLVAHITSTQAAVNPQGKLSVQIRSNELQQIGYQYGWAEQLGQIAQVALEDNEPYLALRLLTAMAEQGVVDAAYKLGMLYDSGIGIEHNSERAVYWYRRAAEAGNLRAQHNLGVAYANGDGVKLDFDKALAWWTLAASSGNADSQYNLGIVYATGVHGVTKNLNMAKKWWRMAAIKGDPMAQYNLGTIYAREGQQASYCEAMRWWEKSAEKGIQQANWALEMFKTRHDIQACR
jgi:TPR repeat protein